MYANSLLLTLNARNVIRNAGRSGTESSFMVPISHIANSVSHSPATSSEFRVARPGVSHSSMEILDEPKPKAVIGPRIFSEP